jgi:hypothetical protein
MKILGVLVLILIIAVASYIIKLLIKKRKSEHLHIVTYNDIKK